MADDTQTADSGELCDRAADLMEDALELLDAAGATQAAAHLDHALYAIPASRQGIARERRAKLQAAPLEHAIAGSTKTS